MDPCEFFILIFSVCFPEWCCTFEWNHLSFGSCQKHIRPLWGVDGGAGSILICLNSRGSNEYVVPIGTFIGELDGGGISYLRRFLFPIHLIIVLLLLLLVLLLLLLVLLLLLMILLLVFLVSLLFMLLVPLLSILVF